MAFKKPTPPAAVPDSPEKLLRELPRRKIPDVLPHQAEVMRAYAATATGAPNVALQLPTGSGKTLVGLLIAEWLRRKNKDRVVYLCATNQLVHQVAEQAHEKYGLTVSAFTGSKKDYSAADKSAYHSAERIAVTNYTSLFNTRPFFADAQVIIVDDAHAAEQYISSLWSLFVDRSDHEALHTALCGVLKPLLNHTEWTRLGGEVSGPADAGWVEKIPTPAFERIRDEFAATVDAHVGESHLQYPWSLLRDHLHACHLYLSPDGILLRPLLPPTWTHEAFERPRQRIFMSATLGAGGDLERLTGRRSVMRIPAPAGWDSQGVGRRFFIFPSMSLEGPQVVALRHELMLRAGRSVVLVPSERAASHVTDQLAADSRFKTFKRFSARDIETSKRPFLSESQAVAVVANRYDGIDFPQDDCRLLFIEGLPKAVNLQERFLMARMAANVLFNERVQTRVLQAIGRCTRGLDDYSAVVVSGAELPEYLTDHRRMGYLHPELQAEIEFGVTQSSGMSMKDMMENFDTFLANGPEWEEVNLGILAARDSKKQLAFPAIEQLGKVVEFEVRYQEALWQSDFNAALGHAESVLGGLSAPELQGYRALWHYLAGSAAWLGAMETVATPASDAGALSQKARLHFLKAKDAARSLPWLVSLSRFQPDGAAEAATRDIQTVVVRQVEQLEQVFAKLGTVHDKGFTQREKQILEGLQRKEKGPFEEAHRLLGETLGFIARKREETATPDPWWFVDRICLVFEDHAGALPTSTLDATKARQAATHPNWIRERGGVPADAEIQAVLVTPVRQADDGAMPHLKTVALWPLDEFRAWAQHALTVLRELRRTFVEPGDLEWRANACAVLEREGLAANVLLKRLRERPAAEGLKRR